MSIRQNSTRHPVSSPYLVTLQDDLQKSRKALLASFAIGRLTCDVTQGRDSVWCLVRNGKDGGLAIRAAFLPVDFSAQAEATGPENLVRVRVKSAMGEHLIEIAGHADELEHLRVQTAFTPEAPMQMPFAPRDLYPLGKNDDPMMASGSVEASQRGLNVAMAYLKLDEPEFGNVLYFQNLTSLNPYFSMTGTRPDEIVGGQWPELGMLLPTVGSDGKPTDKPLEAGKAVILSDAVIVMRQRAAEDETTSARNFLQLLGAAYRTIDRPETEYHDWMGRAAMSLRDLARAPAATIRHYGHRYVHPYTGAEYPDSMVQLSVMAALHDWGKWHARPVPLEAELAAGLRRFFDRKLGAIRRYLPNVGDDKNANAVDSWYLYHPMLNLAHLALAGDRRAKRLFLDSMDFAIKAAHHFDYRWPVQYDITDFSVITKDAPADGRGQTDVGGIYAYVMLQAFELTDDKRYLDEAKAALEAAKGLRFHINYQANLTAWGAAACMRMWRISDDRSYLELAYVYLASFFHNSVIWESQIDHARHYRVFMGVTCLQDAPYMAMYECFESFAAFERVLNDSGPDFEPAARMLVSEYCKYALTRAWYYYPDTLPAEAIAEEQREGNGHIDPALSFPMEDLYVDGLPAGQVGQEVYGTGAAFIFATRCYHEIEQAPFVLFCNHFLRAMERPSDNTLSISLEGGDGCTAEVSLLRKPRGRLPDMSVLTGEGEEIEPFAQSADRLAFCVPANGRLVLKWS